MTRFTKPLDPRDFRICEYHIHVPEEQGLRNSKKRKSLEVAAVETQGKRAKVDKNAAEDS